MRYHSKIGLLREVVTEEAVRILVRPSFPCVIGMREKASHSGILLDLPETNILGSPIGGKSMLQFVRQVFETHGDDRTSIPAGLPVKLRDTEEAALPFDQGIHAGLVGHGFDGIAFPVAETGPPIDDRGTGINRESIGNMELFPSPHALGSSALLPSPEIRTEIETSRLRESCPSGNLSVHILIDGFVRDGCLKIERDPSCNLLGRPTTEEMGDHIVSHLLVLETESSASAMAFHEGSSVGKARRVHQMDGRKILLDLTGDRGGASPEG